MGLEPGFDGTAEQCFDYGYSDWKLKNYRSALQYFDHAYDKSDDEEFKKKCKEYIDKCEDKIKEEDAKYEQYESYLREGSTYLQVAKDSKNLNTFNHAKFLLNQAYNLAPDRECKEECKELLDECNDWLSSDSVYYK